MRGVQILKQILKEYENNSRQCINFNKFTIFFSLNTSEIVREQVSIVLGVRYSNNPEKNLGLPNVVGRNRKASFQTLKDHMKRIIDGWSTIRLSQGGKEVFIKSVLQAILTYSMAYFLIVAKFWWKKAHGKKVFIGVNGKDFAI